MVGTVTGVSFADHVGVQRPRHRQPRDGLGVLPLARPHGRRAACTCAASTSRSPSRSPRPTASGGAHRHPRRARRDPRRPGPDAAGAAGRVQQPARRRVHGADGRLRAVDRLGRRRGASCSASSARRSSSVGSSWPRSASGRARPASCSPATSSTGSSARRSRCARRSCCSAVGMFIWLLMIPVIEAAEQTVLQRSIPFERQGRVFGFAQLVENAAAPLTAMFMGPIAERVFMPFMTDGARRRLDRRLVRHRSRARPGADLHARRAARDRRDDRRAAVALVPAHRLGRRRRLTDVSAAAASIPAARSYSTWRPSPRNDEPCISASVVGRRSPSDRMTAAVCGAPDMAWNIASASSAGPTTSSVVTAGGRPACVRRSPHSSVPVVSSNRTCASQPWGTCGVEIWRTRLPPRSRTSPSASGAGGAVAEVRQRDLATEGAEGDLARRGRVQPHVGGAALVGLDVPEADPAHATRPAARWPPPRRSGGTSPGARRGTAAAPRRPAGTG